MRIVLLIIILLNPIWIFSQTKVLSLKTYLQSIKATHPLTASFELIPQKARYELMIAKGFFDPVLDYSFQQKEFGGKKYYSYNYGELKIPTRLLGAEFNIGYEQNQGAFINPENSIPDNGLSTAGLSMPILRNLITDERRTNLRMAQLGIKLSQLERQKELNKLLLNASKQYSNWYQAYQINEVRKKSLALAEIRLNAIKSRYKQGDAPALDTTEATIEVQRRQQELQASELQLIVHRLQSSAYLWTPDTFPLQIMPDVTPTDSLLPNAIFPAIDANGFRKNPEYNSLQIKIQQLGLERKLAMQSTLPNIQAKYNFLQEDNWIYNNPDFEQMNNSYKFGLNFYYPLLSRKERGKFQLAQLKLKEMDYVTKQFERDITIQIELSVNKLNGFANQVNTQQGLLQNNIKMRDGELRRFDNGESSVFLINTREVRMLESEIKLYELKSYLLSSGAEYLYWKGDLFNQ